MTKKPIYLELDEEAYLATFHALPTGRRVRLISELARRLAHDLRGDSSDERWGLIATEGHHDPSEWSDELNDEYDRQPFSEQEEFCIALWGVTWRTHAVLREMARLRKAKATKVATV